MKSRILTCTTAITLAALAIPVQLAAQTFRVLHSFTGQEDGAEPFATLIEDSAGNLYGTTDYGGNLSACPSFIPPGCGVVFKLDANGNETVLHTFTGPPDGANPSFGLVRDPAGNLYGAAGGGKNTSECDGGCGVVFKVDPQGNETVLYHFTGGADGSGPTGVLARDGAGNLYGTTIGGGVKSGIFGFGVVYRLGSDGKETVLYKFTGGADGGYPAAGVIRDAEGNLYGTTEQGGAFSEGIVFKVDTTSKETVLYNFSGHFDGGNSFAPLIRDAAGNLYGTTAGGGTGYGVIFKLDPFGKETVLHGFTASESTPENAGVVRDAAGNLYGTTYEGGKCCGVVFKLDATGKERVLHSFTGGTDGANPAESLLLNSGNLYGTTLFGGTLSDCFGTGCGIVFKLFLPNFEIKSSPTSATVKPGDSTTSTLTLSPVAGFTGTVDLSCMVPSEDGLSCGVSTSSVTLNGTSSATATLSIYTSSTTRAGMYKIEAKGVSGTLSHTTTFTLTVQ